MLQLERFFRRMAYCFGVSLIITIGFSDAERVFYLPIITWVVAGILFMTSWRIQKEYNAIIFKLDGPDATPNDPIAWIARERPYMYHTIWAAVYTFGTYIVVMLPLDWFIDGTRQWRPFFLLIAAVIFGVARIVDPRVRPSFYNKKS